LIELLFANPSATLPIKEELIEPLKALVQRNQALGIVGFGLFYELSSKIA
jgi:hypothetical protein